jgi:AAA+ ATPase superfamily predicted ATPase
MILVLYDIMLDEIYPKSMRVLFTKRESELKQIHFFKTELLAGRQKNLCIMAPRRYGKSMLIKEFILRNKNDKDVLMPYINLESLVTTPYDFTVKFVGVINYQITNGKQNYFDCLTKDALLTTNLPESLKNHLKKIYIELEKASPNPSFLLTLAFSYPRQVSKILNKKMMLFLDEFQEIMILGKQKNVGNPLSLFREHFSLEDTSYVLAGSVVSILEYIFSNGDSPLFAQAEKMYLKPFTRESTAALVDKTLNMNESLIKNIIYRYSAGHPFYIYNLTKRIKMLHDIQDIEIQPDIVKKAFIIETLSVEGKIYDLCDYIYRISLSKARYYAPLKSILNILASEEKLNQSQIARKLKLSQGATKEYLNELIKIGIVAEEDNRYYYKDPVLKYWVAYVQQGVELGGFPNKKDMLGLVKELDEKFQGVSSELGKAKEYEFKVRLEEKYGLKLRNYKSRDGQIEFDLLGKKDGAYYIFEVKWRNRPTDYSDVKKLIEKVDNSVFSGKKMVLYFLSKNDFTQNARKLAKEHDVALLNQDTL